MLTDTLLLITLRWQLAWNSFRGRSLIRRILIIAFFGWVGAAMMGGSAMAGLGAGSLLRFFPALQLESLIPGLILTAIALMLFVNSFGVALGSLFLSSDLERLMTAPVDRRAVFISKILDGTASYYALTLALATPALVMYGIGLRYGPAYYVLTLIALLGTPLLPAGLGSLAVMLVARFAPARRVREFMGLVAAVFGIGCSVISNLNRWWARPGTVSRLDLGAFLEQARQFADLPIPSFVAGKGLAAAGVGNIGLALIDLHNFPTEIFWGLFGGLMGGLIAVIPLSHLKLSEGWTSRGIMPRLPERPRLALEEAVPHFIDGLAVFRDVRLGSRAVALSFAIWLLEVGMFALFGKAFGVTLSMPAWMLIMVAANFISAVPISPSNIGAYEVAIAELVKALGVDAGTAAGFAIAAHLFNILSITAAGATAMWALGLTFDDVFSFGKKAEVAERAPTPLPGSG